MNTTSAASVAVSIGADRGSGVRAVAAVAEVRIRVGEVPGLLVIDAGDRPQLHSGSDTGLLRVGHRHLPSVESVARCARADCLVTCFAAGVAAGMRVGGAAAAERPLDAAEHADGDGVGEHVVLGRQLCIVACCVERAGGAVERRGSDVDFVVAAVGVVVGGVVQRVGVVLATCRDESVSVLSASASASAEVEAAWGMRSASSPLNVTAAVLSDVLAALGGVTAAAVVGDLVGQRVVCVGERLVAGDAERERDRDLGGAGVSVGWRTRWRCMQRGIDARGVGSVGGDGGGVRGARRRV